MIDMGSGLVMPFYSLYPYYVFADLGNDAFSVFTDFGKAGKRRKQRKNGLQSPQSFAAEGANGIGALNERLSEVFSVLQYSEKASAAVSHSSLNEPERYYGESSHGFLEEGDTVLLRDFFSKSLMESALDNFIPESFKTGFDTEFALTKNILSALEEKKISENNYQRAFKSVLGEDLKTPSDYSALNYPVQALPKVLLSEFNDKAKKYSVSRTEKIAEKIIGYMPRSPILTNAQTSTANGFETVKIRLEGGREEIPLRNAAAVPLENYIARGAQTALPKGFSAAEKTFFFGMPKSALKAHAAALAFSGGILTDIDTAYDFGVVRDNSVNGKREKILDNIIGYLPENYAFAHSGTAYLSGAVNGSAVLLAEGRLNGMRDVSGSEKISPLDLSEVPIKQSQKENTAKGSNAAAAESEGLREKERETSRNTGSDIDSIIDGLSAALREAAENSCEGIHF